MERTSFEADFRDYLDSQSDIAFSDFSDSYDQLDFPLTSEGQSILVELKEKKQKYNMMSWDRVHIPEEHVFILDDLSARKMLAAGLRSILLVRDTVRDRLFLFTVTDLFLMPRIRMNRTMKFGSKETIKGKWAIDLRSGRECKSFDEAMRIIRRYVDNLDDVTGISECYGRYSGESIAQQGTVRTQDYVDRDVAEK